jgi:hypothetical protein
MNFALKGKVSLASSFISSQRFHDFFEVHVGLFHAINAERDYFTSLLTFPFLENCHQN